MQLRWKQLTRLRSSDTIAVFAGLVARRARDWISMDPSKVLIEVLQTREALAGMSLAVNMRAVERVSRTSMLGVYFAFMSEQTATVGKPSKFLTSLG
jgi:hypothetical protein